LSLAAFALAGCFPDPVNMRPTVQIEAPTQQVFKGQTWSYTARTLDGDDDSVTLGWASMGGNCPDNFKSPESWPSQWQKAPTYTVDQRLTTSTYCVWAKVTDSHGAADVDTREETPSNHPPVVSIEVAATDKQRRQDGTFPLRTRFVMSAMNTTDEDGDSLDFKEWTLLPPSTSTATLDKCPENMDPALRCFAVDVEGDYVVRVKVSDGTQNVVKASDPLHITRGVGPVAVLKVVSPLAASAASPVTSDVVQTYPLGTEFKFSGKDSSSTEQIDPDGLMFVWTSDFSGATGTTSKPLPCADDMSMSFRCFTGDVPGRYRVNLVVQDGPASSALVSKEVQVLPDAMPCLGTTDPPLILGGMVASSLEHGRDFEIEFVTDDLDPFPPTTSFKNATRFDWFVKDPKSGAFRLFQSGPSNTFHMSSDGFILGDEAFVRVQIRDRDADRSQLQFEKCGPDAPKCAADDRTPPCFQRWTWKTSFVLP
jgi:hypothetical protein